TFVTGLSAVLKSLGFEDVEEGTTDVFEYQLHILVFSDFRILTWGHWLGSPGPLGRLQRWRLWLGRDGSASLFPAICGLQSSGPSIGRDSRAWRGGVSAGRLSESRAMVNLPSERVTSSFRRF